MKLKTRNKTKIFVSSIIIIMLFSSTFTYAQVFKDVPGTDNTWQWAQEYIEKMNKVGIITGYNDATFRPGDSVTKVQALVMIGRMYELDSIEIEYLKAKNEDILNEIKAENWYEDGLAIAIEKGIIEEDVLKDMYGDGLSSKPATKEEICVYLTRVMGLEEEAKGNGIWVLPSFKDVKSIESKVVPYVNMMIDKGIINKKGDWQGNFNPKSSVNRAIMAKMLSIAYDYIKDNNIISNEELQVVEGSITSLMETSDGLYITVEDEDYTKKAYIVDSDTDIFIDGITRTIDDLEEGLKIKAKINKDFKIRRLEGESKLESYDGKVESIVLTNPALLGIEYEKDGKLEEKTFKVAKDANIKIDNKDSYIYNLDEGDLIEIQVKNNRITSIIAQSKDKSLKGIIKEIKYEPKPVLVVIAEDNKEYEYVIGKNVEVKRNDDESQISDLRIGDKVQLALEYEIITKINADVIKKEAQGKIKSIFISSHPKLTILNGNNEETYYISKDVYIEVDNHKSDIYGLRLGYIAEVKVEGNEIVKVDAEARVQNDKYTGTIEYVNSKAQVFVIAITDPVTGEKNSMPIYVTDDTTYTYANGNTTRFSSLDEEDEVFVLGTYDGVIFTAESVIITENNN